MGGGVNFVGGAKAGGVKIGEGCDSDEEDEEDDNDEDDDRDGEGEAEEAEVVDTPFVLGDACT